MAAPSEAEMPSLTGRIKRLRKWVSRMDILYKVGKLMK